MAPGLVLPVLRLAGLAAGAAAVGAGAAPNLNVLILPAGDLGCSDIGAFGSTNHSTPHIGALTSRGMKFTQWSSAPAADLHASGAARRSS